MACGGCKNVFVAQEAVHAPSVKVAAARPGPKIKSSPRKAGPYRNYPALNFVSACYLIIAVICIFSWMISLVTLLGSPMMDSANQNYNPGAGYSALGITTAIHWGAAISLVAVSELIKLLIAIEKNTRR